jgi:hypothetical protein
MVYEDGHNIILFRSNLIALIVGMPFCIGRIYSFQCRLSLCCAQRYGRCPELCIQRLDSLFGGCGVAQIDDLNRQVMDT